MALEFLSDPVFWFGLIILIVFPVYFRHKEKMKQIERGTYEETPPDETRTGLILIFVGLATVIIFYYQPSIKDWFSLGLIPIFVGMALLLNDFIKKYRK